VSLAEAWTITEAFLATIGALCLLSYAVMLTAGLARARRADRRAVDRELEEMATTPEDGW
jgi:hypothetical protein